MQEIIPKINSLNSNTLGRVSPIRVFLEENELALVTIDSMNEARAFCQPIQERFQVYGLGGLPNPKISYNPTKVYFPSERKAAVYKHSAKRMLAADGFIPTSNNQPLHSFFSELDADRLKTGKVVEVQKLTLTPSEVIFKIDLEGRTKEQIMAIQKAVTLAWKQYREILPAIKSPGQWALYHKKIRCHDANSLGILKTHKIADEILGGDLTYSNEDPNYLGNETVLRYILEAEDMINGGYKTLINPTVSPK